MITEETESVNKSLPTNKARTRRLHHWWVPPNPQEKLMLILRLFQKHRRDENTPTLISQGQYYPHTETRQVHQREEESRAMSLANTDPRTLNKILATPRQQYSKRITHADQIWSIPRTQRWFNNCKSWMWYTTVTKLRITHDHLNRFRKQSWQNSTLIFDLKSFQPSGYIWKHISYFHITKAIHGNPTAGIMVNGEKLGAFPLSSGARLRCPLSPLLFGVAQEVLARAVRQEQEIKVIRIGKEEAKLSLFLMMWYYM